MPPHRKEKSDEQINLEPRPDTSFTRTAPQTRQQQLNLTQSCPHRKSEGALGLRIPPCHGPVKCYKGVLRNFRRIPPTSTKIKMWLRSWNEAPTCRTALVRDFCLLQTVPRPLPPRPRPSPRRRTPINHAYPGHRRIMWCGMSTCTYVCEHMRIYACVHVCVCMRIHMCVGTWVCG